MTGSGRIFRGRYPEEPGDSGFELNVADYVLTAKAVQALGVDRAEMPAYVEVKDAISASTQQLLDEEVRRGDVPELTVHIPVGEERGLPDMIAFYKNTVRQYNRAAGPFVIDLWYENLGTTEHNQGKQYLEPGFVLTDKTDPRDRAKLANTFDEVDLAPLEYGEEVVPVLLSDDEPILHVNRGLVYVGMTVDEQRRALVDEQVSLKARGVELDTITVSEFLVRQAKRVISGRDPMMNVLGITKFIHYDEQPPPLGEEEPTIPSGQGAMGLLMLAATPSRTPYPGAGVRRVVRFGLELDS